MEIDRDELFRVFSMESQEHLDAIEQALLALEARPDDPEVLDILFRAAHTFKGNASIVQLESLEAFTHTLEDVLDRMRRHTLSVTSELVSLLLRVVDAFRRAVPQALKGQTDPQPEHAELLALLAGQTKVRRQRRQKTDVASVDSPQTTNGSDADGHRESISAVERPSLRVDVSKLDRMLDLLGEITIARGRVTSLLASGKRTSLDELRDVHHDADRLYLELQEQLMRARTVPVGPTFRRCQRMVRDLALEHGKNVHLVLEGEDVEVDTAVVEGIADPLTHMLRNAIAHGIESPASRAAKGKDPMGTIRVCAQHIGGHIVISVSDDGAGLQRDRILERARALGLVGDTVPNDTALWRLIFEPGFSTADVVTEASGRGMGMNVVRQKVEALRGSVAVSSQPDKGTTVTLRVPLTLAIIEGFSIGVGEETFVLPLDSVVECVDLPLEDRRRALQSGVIQLRGQPLPYARLQRLFDLPGGRETRESLVVLQHEGNRAGIAVDVLHGAGQVVIKPMASLVQDSKAVAGCALLGSGRVALILDVPALLRAAAGDDTSSVEASELSEAS